MKIHIKNIKDLVYLDEAVRGVITDYIAETNDTPTGFAKKVGIHPVQMLRYVNDNKNLNFKTLKKIAENIDQ